MQLLPINTGGRKSLTEELMWDEKAVGINWPQIKVM